MLSYSHTENYKINNIGLIHQIGNMLVDVCIENALC